MKSQILILKYIFQKKNVENDFVTVETFFDDGVSFPKLISLIFDDARISDLIKKPMTPSESRENNQIALNLLFQKNEYIRKKCPKKVFKFTMNFNKENRDRSYLLYLTLSKQCFIIDKQEILNKCNLIIKPLSRQFKNKNDLLKFSSLFSLLNVLTDGNVELVSDDQKDTYKLLKPNFQKAYVPLVIDRKSLESGNHYQFYIQILIIFDVFKQKVDQLTGHLSSQNSEEIIKSQTKFKQIRQNKNDDSFSSSDDGEDDYNNTRKIENIENEAILNTLNFICEKIGYHTFSNFEEAVKNDAIPEFVIYYLKKMNMVEKPPIDIIQNSESVKKLYGSEKMTENQVKNIESIIEFLRTKNNTFNLLIFDFANLMYVETSTILFYKNFLNCFFVTTSKYEMYQRTIRLLCTVDNFKEKYNFRVFTKYRIYPCLLHFLTVGDLHFTFDYRKIKIDDGNAEEYFKNAKIPMISNQSILKVRKNHISFPIFYQLQFIFNAIDSKKNSSRKIVELFASAIYKLKKVEFPNFNLLSIKHQREMYKKYGTEESIENEDNKNNDDDDDNDHEQINQEKVENDDDDDDENEETNPAIEKVQQETKNRKKQDSENNKIYLKIFEKNKNYLYENGIVYNKKISQKQSQKEWENEFISIQKDIKKTTQKVDDDKNDKKSSLCRKISGMKTKLYKIFVYKEEEDKWIYNETEFKQFSMDKRIDIKCSKTPLVLFINSYEEELIALNSNMLNIMYPNLETNENDEIYVYGLCERSLSNLNFEIDYSKSEKASIKPIFLLLHIPKSKENLNIRVISTRIYSFLSTISDLEITVLNQTHYLSQIEFIKNILLINRFYDMKNEKEKEKEKEFPFLFTVNPHESRLDYNQDLFYNPSQDIGEDVKAEFHYKEPKFIFLMNDQTIQFNEKIDESIRKSGLFKIIQSKIFKENRIHFINVNEYETYYNFLTSLNEMLSTQCCLYEEVFSNFYFVNHSKFEESYINLMSKEDYHEDLESCIYGYYKIFKQDKSNDELNDYDRFSKIDKKFIISSIDNIEFIREAKEIIRTIDIDDIQNIRKILKCEVKKASSNNLKKLKNFLDQKYFVTYQQMTSMINSHKNFLKKSLYEIVLSNFNDHNSINIQNLIFFNYNILKRQMEKDKIVILNIFKPFIDKIKIKETLKYQDLRNSKNEGTNYSMKESENIREIKVTVQINKDLKSEIEQDF